MTIIGFQCKRLIVQAARRLIRLFLLGLMLVMQKEFSKRDRIVVLGVARTVYKCDGSLLCGGQNGSPRARNFIELCKVEPAKLLPLFWMAMKALAKLIAWGGILEPRLDLQRFPGNAARPQTINQEPCVVFP